MAKHHVEVQLSCHHKLLFVSKLHVPHINENVYCPRCQDMRPVINTPAGWLAECQDCGYRERRVTAEKIHQRITGHLQMYPSHAVILTDFAETERYRVTRGSSPVTRTPELTLFDL